MSKPAWLIIVFIMVFTSQLCSQNNEENDVVYMNNGTFLRGRIVEVIPGKSLKIIVVRKDTLEIQMSEVKMVRKENSPDRSKKGYENGLKESGYTIIAEVNVGSGLSEGVDKNPDSPQSQYSVMLSVFNGVTITSHIQLGLGTGLDLWTKRIFLPMYFDLRANILKGNNTPFLFVNVGYSLGWMNGQGGGGLGGATAGVGGGGKFSISKKQVMVLALGYHFQQTRLWQVNNGIQVKATYDAHFLIFKAGFIF